MNIIFITLLIMLVFILVMFGITVFLYRRIARWSAEEAEELESGAEELLRRKDEKEQSRNRERVEWGISPEEKITAHGHTDH